MNTAPSVQCVKSVNSHELLRGENLLLASASSHCLFKGEPFYWKTIICKKKTSETTRLRRCPTSNMIDVIYSNSTLKQRPPSTALVPVPWPVGSLHSGGSHQASLIPFSKMILRIERPRSRRRERGRRRASTSRAAATAQRNPADKHRGGRTPGAGPAAGRGGRQPRRRDARPDNALPPRGNATVPDSSPRDARPAAAYTHQLECAVWICSVMGWSLSHTSSDVLAMTRGNRDVYIGGAGGRQTARLVETCLRYNTRGYCTIQYFNCRRGYRGYPRVPGVPRGSLRLSTSQRARVAYLAGQK